MGGYTQTTVRDASGAITGYVPLVAEDTGDASSKYRLGIRDSGTFNLVTGEKIYNPVSTDASKNLIGAVTPEMYNRNQNAGVVLDLSRNTSNIDSSHNQPASAVGKEWAFGNPQYEGTYKPVKEGTMTLGDVSHQGTLYISDTGRWQVIDKRGQLAMSGSEGAPLPKISDEYDTNKWINISNYVPKAALNIDKVAGIGVTAVPDAATPVSNAAKIYNDIAVIQPATEQTNKWNTYTGSDNSPIVVATPKAKTDNPLAVSWGTAISYPSITSQKNTYNNVTRVGDYDVYDNGKVILRSTGEQVTNEQLSKRSNDTRSLDNIISGSSDLFNNIKNYAKANKPHLAGEFGAKRDIRRPIKKSSAVKQRPNSGFMEIYNNVKRTTPKKSLKSSKSENSLGLVYTNIFSASALDSKPKTTKKSKITIKKKEPKLQSAWESVLFRTPKKTNTKKQK